MRNQLIENSQPMSRERERELLFIVQNGNKDCRREAAGELIESQSRWIMSVIGSLSPPKWLDSDTIFADIMPTLLKALDQFDTTKHIRLTTFLNIVTRRAATRIIRRSVKKSRRECSSLSEDLRERRDDRKLVESEELAHAVRDMLSSDSLSQRSKFIIDRLARGVTREEICSQLGVTPAQLASEMRRIQNAVAVHLTRKAKLPHEGIIPQQIIDRAERSIPSRDVFGREI